MRSKILFIMYWNETKHKKKGAPNYVRVRKKIYQ